MFFESGEDDMRKITVRPKPDSTLWWIGDKGFTPGEVEALFGEEPPEGESREFFVVPAGQVAELKLRRCESDEGPLQLVYLSGHAGSAYLDPVDDVDIFGVQLAPGETRKVTAIIHDAEVEPPKPYERLRQGWFRHEGATHQVQETPVGYSTVSVMPMLRDKYLWKPSELESKGIQITWYGDDV